MEYWGCAVCVFVYLIEATKQLHSCPYEHRLQSVQVSLVSTQHN